MGLVMNEKLLVVICVVVGLIALAVAVTLGIRYPEPSIQIGKIIDTCINAFYFSFIGLVGVATG